MTIWYVRPDASHGGSNKGTSFDNAWQGWASLVWAGAGIVAGDTLYLCGAHTSTSSLSFGAHGATSTANKFTLRGDYAPSPGTVTFSGTGFFNVTRQWTTIQRLTVNGMAGFSCILGTLVSGFVVDQCTLVGGSNGVGLSSTTAFLDATISNNIIHGQTIAGINHSIGTASIVASGITIRGNTIYGSSLYGILVSINSTGWTTSTFANYKIQNNTVYSCAGSSIYVRSCHSDTTTSPTVYSSELVISSNTVYSCGTIAGASGNHGGLLVMGFANPLITNNVVRDSYVTGGGIQTAKNKSAIIAFNTVHGIRAGTPTAAYQNGLPIDGNGIFFDNLTIGGLAFGNRIYDLITTGNVGSGAGLAVWDCSGVKFTGNVVTGCACGAIYGNSTETGNMFYHNTFVTCTVGVQKVGVVALAGNVTVKNNIFKSCTTGFSITANPGITADYNCVNGSTTDYSGISAGANDLSIDPSLDSAYRPQNPHLKRAGIYLGGKDYNGKQFYNPPNIGAVDDLTSTPRYLLLSR